MNTDYIIVFIAAIIYAFTITDVGGSSLPAIIGTTLGTLFIPLVIAGIIKIFSSTKFSKIFMWTTVVVLTASALGNSL
tara:strand:- start:55 stop:288 length:234 start_codon:yes stop_codon:yes gene_type:complete